MQARTKRERDSAKPLERLRAVLEMIDQTKPETANSIRELMFIFEDIMTLDDAAIREIIRRVD